MRDLRRGVERHLARRLLPVADAAAGLHRHRGDALVDDAQLDGARRALHRRLEALGLVDQGRGRVVRVLGVHERGAVRERGLGVADDRKGVVVDEHEVGAVARDVAVVRDHDRDGLADVADLVPREQRLLGLAHVRAGRVGGAEDARRRRQGGVGQHAVDARQGLRRRDVDALHLRVAERRAHEHRVQHAGQAQVVDVAALARHELAVLLAQDGLADPAAGLPLDSRHGQLLAIWSAALRTAATMFW